jgi:hypothetical protein
LFINDELCTFLKGQKSEQWQRILEEVKKALALLTLAGDE